MRVHAKRGEALSRATKRFFLCLSKQAKRLCQRKITKARIPFLPAIQHGILLGQQQKKEALFFFVPVWVSLARLAPTERNTQQGQQRALSLGTKLGGCPSSPLWALLPQQEAEEEKKKEAAAKMHKPIISCTGCANTTSKNATQCCLKGGEGRRVFLKGEKGRFECCAKFSLSLSPSLRVASIFVFHAAHQQKPTLALSRA